MSRQRRRCRLIPGSRLGARPDRGPGGAPTPAEVWKTAGQAGTLECWWTVWAREGAPTHPGTETGPVLEACWEKAEVVVGVFGLDRRRPIPNSRQPMTKASTP